MYNYIVDGLQERSKPFLRHKNKKNIIKTGWKVVCK